MAAPAPKKSDMLTTIRRALGRMVTQAHVRELSVSPTQIETHPLSVRTGAFAGIGLNEDAFNNPPVLIRLLDPPATTMHGGLSTENRTDSLFYSRVSGNYAAIEVAESTRLWTSLVASPDTISASLAPRAGDATVRTVSVAPTGGQAVAAQITALPKAVQVDTLPVTRLSATASGRLRAQRNGLPGRVETRVAKVPATLSERIPLERRRLPMPSRTSLEWQAAYLHERQLLAHSAGPGIPFTEIDLVGIYRNVPISAARRLEVEKGTDSLLLYLRPQLVQTGDTTHKPVVTIAIGRVKSDGRLVRAVIRQQDAPRS